jgi:transcriptional regulator with XRE-family HTH domain
VPRRKASSTGKTPFSLRLQALRKQSQLKMDQLAQAVGVSKSFISLLESGGRQPSREVVLNLSEALSAALPDHASDAQNKLRDELLILAGFMPVNPRAVNAYRDTLLVYQQLLAENPDDFRLFSRWLLALIRAERQEEAYTHIQEGLQRFQETAYMQCLLAHLELSKGNYEAALINQESALKHVQQHPVPHLTEADLIFNLGAIHFLMGHRSMREGDQKTALSHYEQAIESMEASLAQAASDIYVLDEYARLLFNRAYLTQEHSHWEQTIQAYRRVLIDPKKAALGVNALRESAAFLAHAYTQNQDFATAELTLGLLSAFQVDYWLVSYLQACLYTAMFQASQHQPLLDQALQALAQGFEQSPDRVREEALHDPDLQVLRERRAKDFDRLLKEKTR